MGELADAYLVDPAEGRDGILIAVPVNLIIYQSGMNWCTVSASLY
jgi:hypothetical protein